MNKAAGISLAVVLLLVGSPALQAIPGTVAETDIKIGQELRSRIEQDPDTVGTAFVSVEDDVDRDERDAVASADTNLLRVYPDFGLLFVRGTFAEIEALADLDEVERLTANTEIEWATKTEAIASRARDVWTSSSTHSPLTLDGDVVDGDGVGVATIDQGIDATHPDLQDAVVENREFVCSTPAVRTSEGRCFGYARSEGLTEETLDGCTDALWQEARSLDVGGHGTLVAGALAGQGVASHGIYTGSAPGASLYGLGIGDADVLLHVLEALQWINCYHDEVAPSIEVVSMTMAGTPASATQEAIRHLADEEGITVVIAAGNQGCCDGVNPLGQLSTPGVLTVANYDDEGAASRDGSIHWSSSRCSAYQDAKQCPDLAAPGTDVTSTRSSTSSGYTFLQFAPYYVVSTGTSFSAPHVAGIAALLLDADPSLTPAEIEDVLEDTARPMEEEVTLDDPTNEGSISVAAGHGLVDAAAALQDPRVEADASSIDKLPPVDSEPHVYPGKTVDAQPAGVPGQAPVAWTVPSGVESGIAERLVRTGNETAWPLETGQPCRFQISHDGQTFPADCDGGLIEDSGYEVFAATATYDFPEPGLYHVEAQIDFPNEGFQTIESFNVRAR